MICVEIEASGCFIGLDMDHIGLVIKALHENPIGDFEAGQSFNRPDFKVAPNGILFGFTADPSHFAWLVIDLYHHSILKVSVKNGICIRRLISLTKS